MATTLNNCEIHNFYDSNDGMTSGQKDELLGKIYELKVLVESLKNERYG